MTQEKEELRDTWKAIIDLSLIISDMEDNQLKFDLALAKKIDSMQETINEIQKKLAYPYAKLNVNT